MMLSAQARLDWYQLPEVFLMKPLAAARSILQPLQRVPELLDDFAENRLWQFYGDRNFVDRRQMNDRCGIIWRDSDPDLLDRDNIAVQTVSTFLRPKIDPPPRSRPGYIGKHGDQISHRLVGIDQRILVPVTQPVRNPDVLAVV
jgi:hypothetical protein